MTNKWPFAAYGIITILASIFYILLAGTMWLVFGVLDEFFGLDLPMWVFGLYAVPGILGFPAGIFLLRRKHWGYSLITGCLVFFFPVVQLILTLLTTENSPEDFLNPTLLLYIISLILGVLFIPLMRKGRELFG